MSYEAQDRGSAAAYAEYFASMDRSMRQKIALVTSFFPSRGTVADMGCGSGMGSYDLAALYRGLQVVGVDVSAAAVEHARETFTLPNLSFQVGDIAQAIFPPESLDGVLNSSVLHHVTSFNGFSNAPLEPLFDNQIAALREGGIFVVRDFVIPAGPEEVVLELESANGDAVGEIESLSVSALFERFIQGFRCAAYPHGSIPLVQVPSPNRLSQTSVAFRTSLRLATEFVLRKDYRDSWDVELQEEYLYFTKNQFEQKLQSRGVRILLSKELYNPWILAHRFEGQFLLYDTAGHPLPYPPTTYVIIGEKCRTGVRLTERVSEKRAAPGYLERRSFTSGAQHVDLIRRPFPVVDLLPWYTLGNDIYALCRQGYPRPIACSANGAPRIDGAFVSGYINEPIVAVVQHDELTPMVLDRLLAERAGLGSESVRSNQPGLSYFPSPGGTDERVRAYLLEIAPPTDSQLLPRYDTGFTSPGRIRSVEAEQYLRACQVGGMFDARLELNIYDLLLRLKRPLGPWIELDLRPFLQESEGLEITSVGALLHRSSSVHFTESDKPASFLEHWRGTFAEYDHAGTLLAEREFEYVTPRLYSTNTVAALPFASVRGRVVVGLEARDLPSIEVHTGGSRIYTVPAWRLPLDIHTIWDTKDLVSRMFLSEFGLPVSEPQSLGGGYYPSIGISPEQVSVFAVPLPSTPAPSTGGTLSWVALDELIAARHYFLDGHLLVAALRLAHALDLGPSLSALR